MIKRILVLALASLLLAACEKAAPGPTTPTPTLVTAATTPTPAIFPSLPEMTPTSSASPTPFTPFNVVPAVDNLKLRMNPGYLFEAWRMVQQTDTLAVQGKAPGGEWIYVKTEDGAEGWVFAELLKSAVNLEQIPVREPQNVVVIKGRVLDAAGTPIQGVGFEVKQGADAAALTNTVVTDANGDFYAFLPEGTSGTWAVTYTAIACKSNVWSDSTCSTYKAGYSGAVEPQTLNVTLPQLGPLTFTWR